MGCANSKEFRKDKNGHVSPVRHSITLYPRHHLEGGQDGESSDIVARKSATLGCNHEDSFVEAIRQGLDAITLREQLSREKFDFEGEGRDRFDAGLSEAKIWSSLMDERITNVVPKTPIRTPPGEPENIYLWELMEGLEDTSPFIKHVRHGKSFSFNVSSDAEPVNVSLPADGSNCIFGESVKDTHDACELVQNVFSHSSSGLSCTKPEGDMLFPDKPKGLEMSPGEKDSLPEFDPEIISMFRKSMADLSPEKQYYVPTAPLTLSDDDEQLQGLSVKKTFQSSKKDRVVLYFTSLRGIRKTYEDCCHVRVIFQGLKVRVDEKDLCMHSGFKEELKQLMGDTYKGRLPIVFIGNKYIGGADEIRRLHEDGELEKLAGSCEMIDIKGNGGNSSCEACGDVRFIPCETCSGSCKIFYDYDEEDEETNENFEDDGFGFHRCPDCNENGLIRCPLCCD